jgi:hypothetical protein
MDGVTDGDKDGRSARRRRALTEFELLRDPHAPDHLIAKRVRCSTSVIGPIRASLKGGGGTPQL